MLSQLLHGEQAALQLCGQLVNVCDKMDQKWYAASQVIDEARHVEVLSKFLARKMGTIYPIGATLKYLLDELLEAEGLQKKTLGMQTLFEGTAVGIMDLMRAESRNALFTEMIQRVEQDESRHAAFGVLTMRRVVKEARARADGRDGGLGVLHPRGTEREPAARHAARARAEVRPRPGEPDAHDRWRCPNFADLNSLAFMHTVVPNLQRLGLITERTEAGWRKAAMLVDHRGGMPTGSLPLVS